MKYAPNYLKKHQIIRTLHAVNEQNAAMYRILCRIKPLLDEFVGKQIGLATGNLSKKFTDKLHYDLLNDVHVKPYENGHVNIRFRFDYSKYSLYLKTTINISGGKYEDKTYYCNYYDNSYFLGDIENSVLTKTFDLSEAEFLKKEIDVVTQENVINEYNQKLKEIDELYSKIHYQLKQ